MASLFSLSRSALSGLRCATERGMRVEWQSKREHVKWTLFRGLLGVIVWSVHCVPAGGGGHRSAIKSRHADRSEVYSSPIRRTSKHEEQRDT